MNMMPKRDGLGEKDIITILTRVISKALIEIMNESYRRGLEDGKKSD